MKDNGWHNLYLKFTEWAKSPNGQKPLLGIIEMSNGKRYLITSADNYFNPVSLSRSFYGFCREEGITARIDYLISDGVRIVKAALYND